MIEWNRRKFTYPYKLMLVHNQTKMGNLRQNYTDEEWDKLQNESAKRREDEDKYQKSFKE